MRARKAASNSSGAVGPCGGRVGHLRLMTTVLIVLGTLAPRPAAALRGGPEPTPLHTDVVSLRPEQVVGTATAIAKHNLSRALDIIQYFPRPSTDTVDPPRTCPWYALGQRVQVIYASVTGERSRYGGLVPDIRVAMGMIDSRFDQSARKTGGRRFVRWVLTPECDASVSAATISAEAVHDFARAKIELRGQGFNDPDRKYLVWIDPETNQVCSGTGDLFYNDQPGLENPNNAGGTFGIVRLCNDLLPSQMDGLAAHELMHTLGAVQLRAPNTTGEGHCMDGYDTMCLGSGWRCTDISEIRLFDCGNDDYFYAGTPPSGNYLASRWNTANSSFLVDQEWPRG